METMSYIECDVPAGMDLRQWRRATERKQRRRLRLRLPRRRH
jgi:hypothetical protein